MAPLRSIDFSGVRKAAATLAVVGTVLISGAVANAANVVVDFSEFSEGDVLNGLQNFGGVDVTISVNRFDTLRGHATGDAVICDTTPGSECAGFDPDLKSDFTNVHNLLDKRDFGNALILEEIQSDDDFDTTRVDDAAKGGEIIFDFGQVVELTRIILLDGNDNGPNGISLFLDGSTSFIAQKLGGPDNHFEDFEFDDGTFASQLKVRFSGSGAIGQFGFAAVPVPATLPLLLAGLGALAWMAGKRRKLIA